MKNYTVRIPVVAYVEVEVEANNKIVAIERAFKVATLDDLIEWELYEEINNIDSKITVN